MSSVLPRPCDHEDTDIIIKDVNRILRQEMGPDLGFTLLNHGKLFLNLESIEDIYLPKMTKIYTT